MAAEQYKRGKLFLESLESRLLLSRSPWAALEADDIGDTFRDAYAIELDDDGNATLESRIDSLRDMDMFIITPTGTGTLQIDMTTPDSDLDSYLFVYNSRGRCIARNDDSNGDTDAHITINVQAGEVIYIRADAFQKSTGSYALIIDAPAEGDTYEDDFGDTFEDATVIELDPSGFASQSGQIGWAGDQDIFAFTALADGFVQVDMLTPDSDLDSYLYIYDANGRCIARNDDSGLDRDAMVVFEVQKDQAYYVRADAWRDSIGSYSLELAGPTANNEAPQIDDGDNDETDEEVIDTGDGQVEGWALLVASWDYADDINDLPECAIDLEMMQSVLIEEYGFSADAIRIVSGGAEEVSVSVIDAEFTWLQDNADGDDIVFFNYTGHGAAGDRLYLDDNEALDLASGEYYTEADLQSQLNTFDAATTKIVVLDTCFAGGFANLGNTVSNTCVLASSNYYQSSWGQVSQFMPRHAEGSVFTSWLIEAMRDDGSLNVDANQNGRISMAEAFTYADSNICSVTRGRNYQDPVMLPSEGEFEIVLDSILLQA